MGGKDWGENRLKGGHGASDIMQGDPSPVPQKLYAHTAGGDFLALLFFYVNNLSKLGI